MAKEKNFNPVQAQRKADKAKALKKGRAEARGRRDERLARKNPDRLQKQIDDLKAISTNGGALSKNEEQILDGLEKELKAVKKAREALGDKAPGPSSPSSSHGPRRDGGRVLGKRRRDGQHAFSSDDDDDRDIPEEVRAIPMPRDTPPPIPKEVMDQWYAKRRARREAAAAAAAAANKPDGGGGDGEGEKKDKEPTTAAAETKTVYSAEPVRRDLQKEAVAAFVPSVVQQKMMKGQGKGGLMEPEEADRLEREGYLKAGGRGEPTAGQGSRTVTMEEVDDEEG
ncbi:WW domain binding protein 11 [Geosmithia morbida]|uniref:WW domain binding protein 11 n=1 Tax=Geosmithia morbida TaxID=1094350 RepID=A0A9P5D358_9HYPO|nr:WW domain binding protein 11 [Geosmithia morbida]KAF4124562.1 WW domain binding protein 11 [Geosmithia morbida]